MPWMTTAWRSLQRTNAEMHSEDRILAFFPESVACAPSLGQVLRRCLRFVTTFGASPSRADPASEKSTYAAAPCPERSTG